MVRPGAPPGPQTATTRPAPRAASWTGAGGFGVVVRGRGRGEHGVGQPVEPPGVDGAGQAEAGEHRGDVGGGVRLDHRDRAYAVPAQVVDRRRVEARGVQRHHGHRRLAGGGGGHQVGDVHAALEHHDGGTGGQLAQGRGLPRRAGGDHEDAGALASLPGPMPSMLNPAG